MSRKGKNFSDVNSQRRRLLAGVAGAGVGLSSLGTLDLTSNEDVAAAASELYFDGVKQVATGSADLTIDNDELVVSNFDGGLDDGTCVPVNAAEGFRTRTTFDPSEPSGSQRRFLSRGYIDGTSGQTLGFADLERIDSPDGYSLRPDFSAIDADGYKVEVYDDSDLLYEGGPFTEPTQIEFDSSTTTEDSVGTNSHGSNTTLAWWKWMWTGSSIRLVLCIQVFVYVWTPDGTQTYGNRIRIIPVNTPFSPGPFSECDAFGANWNSFRIFRYGVLSFGRFHRQAGTSWLWPDAFNSELEIQNVGSGGDGVTTNLNFVNGFKQGVQGIDFSNTDATATASARGDFSGNSFAPVGSATLTQNNSGGVSVSTDFSDVNASNVRFVVYDNGSKVGETTVSDGSVGRLDFQPTLAEAGYMSGSDPGVCFEYGSSGTIVASGGTQFVGDELRLLAKDNSDPVNSLSDFTLTAGNVGGSFTIVDEYTI